MRIVLEVLVLTSIVGPVFLQADEPVTAGPPVDSTRGPVGMEDRMKRLQTTKRRVQRRTTPPKVSFPENCDYLAFYCLKAFINPVCPFGTQETIRPIPTFPPNWTCKCAGSGKVCAKTVYSTYYTFKNYCMLDYVNCMERYDLWQPVYMGECIEIQPLDEYGHYPYDDDLFLDQYYIIEDV